MVLKAQAYYASFLKEKKRERCALWEKDRGRITRNHRTMMEIYTGPLSCNGLHCPLAGFQGSQYERYFLNLLKAN